MIEITRVRGHDFTDLIANPVQTSLLKTRFSVKIIGVLIDYLCTESHNYLTVCFKVQLAERLLIMKKQFSELKIEDNVLNLFESDL